MSFIALIVSLVLHLFFLKGVSPFGFTANLKAETVAPVFVTGVHGIQRIEKKKLQQKRTENVLSDLKLDSKDNRFLGVAKTLTPEEIVKSGNTLPVYPQEAIDHGWQGTVELKLTLKTNGQVSHTEILRTSGYPLLDLAAIQASKEWKFDPLFKKRVLVAPIKFVIES